MRTAKFGAYVIFLLGINSVHASHIMHRVSRAFHSKILLLFVSLALPVQIVRAQDLDLAESMGVDSVLVQRFVQSLEWVDFPAPVDYSQLVSRPVVAFDQANNPVVAYQKTISRNGLNVPTIYVSQWNGQQWQALGAELNVSRVRFANLPRIAIDSQNRPIVCWYEGTNRTNSNFAVFVKRWNGTEWEFLGSVNPVGDSSALSHDVAVDPLTDQPIVSYSQSSPFGLVFHVKQLKRNGWRHVGSPLEFGKGYEGRIAVDSRGRIVVVWSREVAYDVRKLFARRWNGNRWISLGETLSPTWGERSSSPALALNPLNDKPFVAWQETSELGSSIMVAGWNQGLREWETYEGQNLATISQGGSSPEITFLPIGGISIAWENRGLGEVFVGRWAWLRDEWQPLGLQPVVTESSRGFHLTKDNDGLLTLAFGQSFDIFNAGIFLRTLGGK